MTIFNYSNYRVFLRETLRKRPKRGHGELSRLAKAISVHSTLISQVLNGTKDFSLEQAQEVCEYFGWIRLEAEYFMALIQLERAGTAKLKDYFREKLRQLKQESQQLANRVRTDHELKDEERARFYSDWIYSAVRLSTSISGYQTVDKLAEKFELPAAKIAEILRFLVECGLCSVGPEGYGMGVQRTHLPNESPFLNQHRLNWHMKAMQRASRLSSEELMFTCPCSIREGDFHKFREQLVELIRDFYEVIKAPDADRLACLNIDWFNVEK